MNHWFSLRGCSDSLQFFPHPLPNPHLRCFFSPKTPEYQTLPITADCSSEAVGASILAHRGGLITEWKNSDGLWRQGGTVASTLPTLSPSHSLIYLLSFLHFSNLSHWIFLSLFYFPQFISCIYLPLIFLSQHPTPPNPPKSFLCLLCQVARADSPYSECRGK